MDPHPLHPYLATAMGLSAPPAEGTDPQVEPDPQLAPPNTTPGDGSGVAGAGEDTGLPPEADLAAALGGGASDAAAPPAAEAPAAPEAAAPADPMAQGAPTAPAAPGPEAGMEEGPTPGVPDPNDPLRNTKDEGLYASNEADIVGLLQKILAGKYAIMVMYLHYGATMLTLSRDGLFKHFLEHAEEEQKSAYLVAKTIVALGGQAAPKVGTVRPALDLPTMLSELLKAEQKVQQLWRELNLAAGQNLGLQSMAQSQCELDFQHANDLRRWMRSAA
jgi:bacterioferritin (cytochrome b1)